MNSATEDTFENVEQLESVLSEPTPEVIAALAENQGDIVLLGVARKMGPEFIRENIDDWL